MGSPILRDTGSQQGSHTHSSTNGGGATGPSRRMDLTSLNAAVQGYFHNGLAPSTHRTYDAAMRRFNKFCVLYDIYDPFPVTEKLMCYFATSLANDGLAPQTIKCYLSAVRSMQISLGLPPPSVVSSPDPYSQQLRVDYITATWKVGLGNKNGALVPSVLQCLCPKIVRQSKFRTNLAQLERNKRYHFPMILLRVLSIAAFGRAASEDWVCSPLPFSGRVLQN